MSFKVVCGLFSQVFVVSSNIILEASRGQPQIERTCIRYYCTGLCLVFYTIFLLLIMTKSQRMRTSFRVLWKVKTVGLCKSHIIEGQNECHQMTRWQKVQTRIIRLHFLHAVFFGESPKEFWLHMCQACIIAARRLELRPPPLTSNHPSFRAVNVNTGGPTTVLIPSLSIIITFCTDELLRNSPPDYES